MEEQWYETVLSAYSCNKELIGFSFIGRIQQVNIAKISRLWEAPTMFL